MKKQEQTKNWWEADFSELGIIEPNILHQIKTACEELVKLFGEIELDQRFMYMGKDIKLHIEIKD